MKNKYKFTVVLLALMITLIPVLIFAQGKGKSKGKGGSKDAIILDKGSGMGGVACEAIEHIYSKIEERIAKKEEKLKNKEDNILNRVKERREERERKMEERREKWDENRAEHFAMLEEKTDSDEQKQAVLAFVETIQTAVKTRRNAFDEAINEFKDGLDSVHAQRTTTLLGAISEYKELGQELFEQIKGDCESGGDIKTIRKNLRDGLKDIRDSYRGNVRGFGGHGEDIHELNEAKKEAMNDAKDEFKETLDQALENLKESFPEVDDDEEGEEAEDEEVEED